MAGFIFQVPPRCASTDFSTRPLRWQILKEPSVQDTTYTSLPAAFLLAPGNHCMSVTYVSKSHTCVQGYAGRLRFRRGEEQMQAWGMRVLGRARGARRGDASPSGASPSEFKAPVHATVSQRARAASSPPQTSPGSRAGTFFVFLHVGTGAEKNTLRAAWDAGHARLTVIGMPRGSPLPPVGAVHVQHAHHGQIFRGRVSRPVREGAEGAVWDCWGCCFADAEGVEGEGGGGGGGWGVTRLAPSRPRRR